MRAMRAETFKGYKELKLVDLPKPAATDGKVLVRMTDQVPVGSGQVDWPKLLRAAQKAGLQYYLIEDESPSVLEQIPQSLRYLESVSW